MSKFGEMCDILQGTVLIENADELMNFSKGEEQEVEKQVKEIADAGVKVRLFVFDVFEKNHFKKTDKKKG